MWALVSSGGRVSKALLWDREVAIGGSGRVTTPAVAFAGTLATQIKLTPPRRAPEHRGLVERANGHLESGSPLGYNHTHLRRPNLETTRFRLGFQSFRGPRTSTEHQVARPRNVSFGPS